MHCENLWGSLVSLFLFPARSSLSRSLAGLRRIVPLMAISSELTKLGIRQSGQFALQVDLVACAPEFRHSPSRAALRLHIRVTLAKLFRQRGPAHPEQPGRIRDDAVA